MSLCFCVHKNYHDAFRLVANLPFAPGGCKGLSGFPGDFGAMGQDVRLSDKRLSC